MPKYNKKTSSENESEIYKESTRDKTSIKQAIRKLVWYHYMGYVGIGKCWCCNVAQITPFDFECGHVQARSQGGPDTIQNLRPICGLCNRSMGSQNMLEFQKLHGLPKANSYWSYIKTFFGF